MSTNWTVYKILYTILLGNGRFQASTGKQASTPLTHNLIIELVSIPFEAALPIRWVTFAAANGMNSRPNGNVDCQWCRQWLSLIHALIMPVAQRAAAIWDTLDNFTLLRLSSLKPVPHVSHQKALAILLIDDSQSNQLTMPSTLFDPTLKNCCKICRLREK